MSDIPQSRLRNFSIIAHIDHGKSTLADRLLETTHTVDPRQMTSQMLDSMDLEREKGITIKARAVRLEYVAADGLNYGLNLIDTPGHVDFAYEVSRSLQACDGAILVVDASQGIEAQTLANVHLAMKMGLVIIPVLNKIDLPASDPEAVMNELEETLAIPREEVILASAKEGKGIPEILEALVKRVPAPSGPLDAPLKALVFDSHYDTYKGVVNYIRVQEGRLKMGEAITMMGSGAQCVHFILGYLYKLDDDKVYNYFAESTRYFKDDFLSLLDSIDVYFIADTKHAAYLYFRNCAIKITHDGVSTIDYIDLGGYVWKDHVIDRNFSPMDDPRTDFE